MSVLQPAAGRQPIRIAGRDIRCFYRIFVLIAFAAAVLALFWLGSRYPSLFHKAQSLGHHEVSSFIWTDELMRLPANPTFIDRVVASIANWIWSMRIGMPFGLAIGALFHTLFQFYPPKLGGNLYLNTLKGIITGAPAGVCVNCAVPIACGITRGKANIESALSFMFSSPTLNFVVISMIFAGLPKAYGIVQYSMIALVLLVFVPTIVHLYNKSQPAQPELAAACPIPLDNKECDKSLLDTAKEIGALYAKNLWHLIKSAVPLMLGAAVVSAVVMELLPLQAIFLHVSFLAIAGLALVTVLLPIPIALDVIVAQQLYAHSVPAPYVMLFLATLGTFSILPMSYLWTEVSKKLAVGLYSLFVVLGITAAYVIQLFVR
ncbi:MAG: hypothetical protein ACREBW_03450 [Candidatus Micrarchaeaceae archaeon]